MDKRFAKNIVSNNKLRYTPLKKRLTIAVDFDGVCMYDGFPYGKDVPGAERYLKEIAKYHNIVLWTRRSHLVHKDAYNPNAEDTLQIAIDWFESKGIPLYAVNEVESDKEWSSSPKLMYDYLIDDRSIGVPLLYPECVDWGRIWEEYLKHLI